jgi:hypothetical protein
LRSDLKAELERGHSRLELVESQLRTLEAEQQRSLGQWQVPEMQMITHLMGQRGIGLTGAWIMVMEFFGWRDFQNRREVDCAAGLAGTPMTAGTVSTSKACRPYIWGPLPKRFSHARGGPLLREPGAIMLALWDACKLAAMTGPLDFSTPTTCRACVDRPQFARLFRAAACTSFAASERKRALSSSPYTQSR